VFLVTNQRKQQKNIQVRVGIPPVGFVKQYSSGNMQEVLSEFGVSWEEANDQVPNKMSVIVKPREAVNFSRNLLVRRVHRLRDDKHIVLPP